MRTLLFDDQHFNNLDSVFSFELDNPGIPDKIDIEFYKKYSSFDLFIINSNYKAKGILRSQNKGIRLLKFLRLHNLRQHCVLFSLFSREQLMAQDPRNLIIFSEGVTFIRLPYDFSLLNVPGLVAKKSPEDLSIYFKAEYTLPDNRHFFANWWGVLQLWKVQNAIDRMNGIANLKDIESTDAFPEMNSYEGLLARYLNTDKLSNIEFQLKELQQHQKDRNSNKQKDIDLLKKQLDEKIIEFSERANLIETLNESFYDQKTKTLINSILEKFKFISDPIKEKVDCLIEVQKTCNEEIIKFSQFIDLNSIIAKETTQIEDQIKLLEEQIRKNITDCERKEIFSTGSINLNDARKQLADSKPKIIYVDDQAAEGWAEVLQKIIYGAKNDSFTIIQPCKEDSIDKISNQILLLANDIAISADLIILDLRLKSESGTNRDVADISGVQVLKKLTQEGISCPILITTASNKIWSYKETFALGASAFWIKEGLDGQSKLTSSIDNYMRLVDLISVLCLSQEYRFLKECKQMTNLINHKSDYFWWENNNWVQVNRQFIKTKSPERSNIISILRSSFEMLEDFLRIILLESQQISLLNPYHSIIITRLATIIESIHETDDPAKFEEKNKTMPTLSEKIKDQFGKSLYISNSLLKIRNKAVHTQDCSFMDLSFFTKNLLEYLNFNPLNPSERFKNDQPVNGQEYTSEITSQHDKHKNIFYLKNPGLLLNQRENIILDVRPQYNPQLNATPLQPGDIIRFKLSVSEKYSVPNYYAKKAIKMQY